MARELPIQNGRLTTDLDANGFKIKNLPPGSGFTQAQSDWNQTDVTAPDFIKNKPPIPSSTSVDPTLSVEGAAADAKATGDALVPMLLAQYYPDGNVKSASEMTSGIKYTFTSNTTGRTATVKPFCYTGSAENDNSGLAGRVVIPPFVDAQGAPYLIDDGTRYKVVAVDGGISAGYNTDLTAVVAPGTVTSIGNGAFDSCETLASVSLPAVKSIGDSAFDFCYALTSISLPAATAIGPSAFQSCTVLTSVSLPAATTIGDAAFSYCAALTSISLPTAEIIGSGAFDSCEMLASVSLPAMKSIGDSAFYYCYALASADFGSTPRSSVPTLGVDAFVDVPTSCKIIVPDAQYAAWTAASGWSDLVQAGYQFLRHSEWEYARRYEMPAASNVAPLMDGTAAAGSSTAFARGDHVHPKDTSKQDVIADLEAIRSGATAGATAYQKPQAGIPSSDMASGVQTSLDKADTAVQLATLAEAVRYDLPANAITIASASQEVVEGETITYGEATLAGRTANRVAITAAIAELRLMFPVAVSGKVRDFGLRVKVGTGSAALTAPALVPVAPTGETVTLENADGAIPALADGTATAAGVTLLYFSETAPGVFLVRGEEVKEVA